MARITVEDCIDKFPSRFELVLVASQRARNLHSGELSSIDKDNDKNTVIALREIAEESISVNEMKETLIEEFQTVTISDEETENLELEMSTETSDNDNVELKEVDTLEKNQANEIEEEIKELSSAEDSELQEEYEITDDLAQSEDVLSSDDNENSNIS